jgi:chorismate mutase
MKKSIVLLSSVLSLSVFCIHANESSIQHSYVQAEPCSQADAEAVQHLLQAIQKRLYLMHDVARYKWNEHLPIEDKEREKILIDQLAEKAATYHLEKAWAISFLQNQMDAAKLLQEQDMLAWKSLGVDSFKNIPDLKKEIRPKLDQLTTDIFESLQSLSTRLTDLQVKECIQKQSQEIELSGMFPREIWEKAVFTLISSKE